MTDRYEYLKNLCKDFILLDDTALNRLEIYENSLIECNKKINLTAITEPSEIVQKHFFDSLLILKAVNIPQNSSIIDIGTGAGFPGMVLKIARPDLKVTLLDGLNKRLVFLGELADRLHLKVDILHSRAEDASKLPLHRENYDFATARAVAKLNTLSEYCLPFVKVGGFFIAMKGPASNDELSVCENAIKTLGGNFRSVAKESLPDGSERNLCIIKKISQTPPNYPRNSAKISKKPL